MLNILGNEVAKRRQAESDAKNNRKNIWFFNLLKLLTFCKLIIRYF